MARNIKHVGQLINTQRRVVVVFREVPDEPQNCLVVDTDALPDWMHDDVINAVESPSAQAAANFYEYAQRSVFTDGSNMLQTMHNRGLLMKVATDNVMMLPNSEVKIRLDELNTIIREQSPEANEIKAPEDQVQMAGKDTTEAATAAPATSTEPEVQDETSIAKTLLAQAKTFEAEAKNLKEQAYEMAPQLKPGRKKKTADA